jgi:hypothetical protein
MATSAPNEPSSRFTQMTSMTRCSATWDSAMTGLTGTRSHSDQYSGSAGTPVLDTARFDLCTVGIVVKLSRLVRAHAPFRVLTGRGTVGDPSPRLHPGHSHRDTRETATACPMIGRPHVMTSRRRLTSFRTWPSSEPGFQGCLRQLQRLHRRRRSTMRHKAPFCGRRLL